MAKDVDAWQRRFSRFERMIRLKDTESGRLFLIWPSSIYAVNEDPRDSDRSIVSYATMPNAATPYLVRTVEGSLSEIERKIILATEETV